MYSVTNVATTVITHVTAEYVNHVLTLLPLLRQVPFPRLHRLIHSRLCQKTIEGAALECKSVWEECFCSCKWDTVWQWSEFSGRFWCFSQFHIDGVAAKIWCAYAWRPGSQCTLSWLESSPHLTLHFSPSPVCWCHITFEVHCASVILSTHFGHAILTPLESYDQLATTNTYFPTCCVIWHERYQLVCFVGRWCGPCVTTCLGLTCVTR